MRIGEYEVERELARGGMGVVYLARGPNGEQAAIKLLLAAGLATPEDQVRFRREAEALEALDHPGILRVQSHGVDAGRLYMVLDLLPGPTLADVVRLEGPLPEARAVALGLRMATALGHAHARGVVHRDLKPANVILHDGEPVLVDFGLVLQLGDDATRLTESGTVMGSPNYMAPEQAVGETKVGPAADLYGLGASLYYLLTGKPPFEGRGTLEILKQVAGQEPRPLRDVRPELTPALEAVVLRCLEKDPSQRYPTAFALEQGLAELATPLAEGHSAPPAPRPPYGLLLVAAVLAAAAAGLLVVVSQRGPQVQRERSAALVEAGRNTIQAGRPNGLLPSGERRKEAEAWLNSGIAKLEAMRYAEAIADFDRAIELDPENARACVSRGTGKAYQGRYVEALEEFDRALRLGLQPREADETRLLRAEVVKRVKLQEQTAALTKSGDGKAGEGRYREALEDYGKAIALDPRFAPAYFRRGVSKLEATRYAESIADFDRAIELDPGNALAYASRGGSKGELGRFAEAIEDYDKALELDPRNASAFFYRGLSKSNLERFEEAIEDYGMALDVNPRDPDPYFVRGKAKLSLERYEEALHDLDIAIERGLQNDGTYITRGLCRARLGRLGEALEDFQRAVEFDPQNTSAYLNRAAAEATLGRHEQAIETYDRALELDPRSTTSYVGRGDAKATLGRDAEALEDYDRALELDPRRAAAYGKRGACEARLRRFEEAIKDYDKALEHGLPQAEASQVKQLRAEAAAKLNR